MQLQHNPYSLLDVDCPNPSISVSFHYFHAGTLHNLGCDHEKASLSGSILIPPVMKLAVNYNGNGHSYYFYIVNEI